MSPTKQNLVSLLEMQLKVDEAELNLKRQRLELERLRCGLGSVSSSELMPPEPNLHHQGPGSQSHAFSRMLSPINRFPSVSYECSLPRIDIDPFTGSPKEFVRFMHVFEVTIASKAISNTGLLPNLSLRPPNIGANTNCIVA